MPTPYAKRLRKTRSESQLNQKSKVNQGIGPSDVLLAPAIVVALIGIVNMLMLSVFERTDEMDRCGGWDEAATGPAIIRAESVIVARLASSWDRRGTALGIRWPACCATTGHRAVGSRGRADRRSRPLAPRPGRRHLAGAPRRSADVLAVIATE